MARGDADSMKGPGHAAFVIGTEEGEEQRDRHRVRARPAHRLSDPLDLLFRRTQEDAALRVHALTESEAAFLRDERGRTRRAEVVEGRPVLATDCEEVLEARGRDEGGLGSPPFQDRIRRHGRAVGHALRLEEAQTLNDGLGPIPRGWQLRRDDLAPSEADEIGEGPADIDADLHRPDNSCGGMSLSRSWPSRT